MRTSREIDDYLLGNLPEEESVKFAEELKTDKDLASSVLLQKEVNESIVDNDISEYREKINNLLSVNKKIKKLKAKQFIASIAAIFLIALTLASVLKNPNYSKTYVSFYHPYETDLNVRSGSSKMEGLDFALMLYQKGEYEASYEILKNYNHSVFDNYNALFYYGLCAIELEKFDIAEENLLEVLNSEDPSLKLHSKWYLGLVYLQTKQPAKAKFYFNELNKEDNYYSHRVKKIMKKIN